MFCSNCGKEIDDKAVVCPHCGVPTSNFTSRQTNQSKVAADDAPSAGYSVLCFFFPVVGLILYLVWQETYPQRAKSCGKGALIGVIVEVALSILIVIIWAVALGAMMSQIPSYTAAGALLFA